EGLGGEAGHHEMRNRQLRPRNPYRIDGVSHLIGGVLELIDGVSKLIGGFSELIDGASNLIGEFCLDRGAGRWSWTPRKCGTARKADHSPLGIRRTAAYNQCKKRWNMDEKWICKMIQQAFQQYELEGSLSEKEAHGLVAKALEKKQQEDTEWFEIVEDIVYGYVTNQEL
ncbi:YqzH family protein, partial [Metabacillus idriensis]|uniref:YqzH family protein n=1 Tax=Metabacillus idriensis TaxID=324768 RepID=UPI003D2BF2B2